MKLTWSRREYRNMKTVTKVSIKLTSEEYNTIIYAQQYLENIANELDNEGVLCEYKSLQDCFDRVNTSITDILNVIEEGIARRGGE